MSDLLENSPYEESDVQTALQMLSDGVAKTTIAEHLDISRQTLHNWSTKGLLTDGTPWDDWLDDHHATEVVRHANEQKVTRVESQDEFWKDELPKLRAAIKQTTEKMASGDIPLDATDLKKIVSLVRRVENRGQELAMMQEQFMRKALFAVREEVDKEAFRLIREKIKEIRLDQLQEFDEDFAETLLDDAS